jgi:hypothetical protein
MARYHHCRQYEQWCSPCALSAVAYLQAVRMHLVIGLLCPLVHVLDERIYEVKQALDLVHILHLRRGIALD